MELHLELNKEKQVTKVWGCVSSGCMHFEEDESNVCASIDDTVHTELDPNLFKVAATSGADKL
jgi:hypothetical protein